MSMVDTEQDVARAALELQVKMDELKRQLDARKQELRDLANGRKKEIVVEGVGKVSVSEPFAGKEAPVLVFDEDKLNQAPDLRKKLLDKGVAREEVKKVPAAVAKVTIRPNV